MTTAIAIVMTIVLALIWTLVILFSAGDKYDATGIFWIAVIGTLLWALWLRFKTLTERAEKRKNNPYG